ncbi:MAG: hypothetical protein GF421_03685 [Candidatus Aminicenantes bacterium]|nr:hypothetical protein [Candidatus Aminicenantes bacterium]
MKIKYFLQGFKSKSDYAYEDTLILDDKKAYASEEDAINKAKEHFEKDENLQLIVIHKGLEIGPKQGTKFLFKDKEGNLELVDSWWKQDTYC